MAEEGREKGEECGEEEFGQEEGESEGGKEGAGLKWSETAGLKVVIEDVGEVGEISLRSI